MEKERRKSVKPILKLSKPKQIPIQKKASKNTETPLTVFDSQSLAMRKMQRFKMPASKKKVSTMSNTIRNYLRNHQAAILKTESPTASIAGVARQGDYLSSDAAARRQHKARRISGRRERLESQMP